MTPATLRRTGVSCCVREVTVAAPLVTTAELRAKWQSVAADISEAIERGDLDTAKVGTIIADSLLDQYLAQIPRQGT